MKKNYVLAFALSFAVLMGWQYFIGKTQKPAAPTMGVTAEPAPSLSESRPAETPSSTPPIRRESAVVFEIGGQPGLYQPLRRGRGPMGDQGGAQGG
jgi:hypothetical protein